MIILISLKKLSRADKRAIKQHYSLLEFNKQHLNKKYNELGVADVLLFQLDIGVLGNFKNNIVYKYLKSQDLTTIKVVFIYDKTKYRNIIDNVNYHIRRFPKFKGKCLLEECEKQASIDSKYKSRYEPPKEVKFEDEVEEPKVDTLEQTKRLVEIEAKINDLIAEYKKILNYKQPEEEEEEDEPKIERFKIHLKNNHIIVESDQRGIIEKKKYANSIQRRRYMKDLRKIYL